MSALFGIRMRLADNCWVWTGYALHSYAFRTWWDALRFIAGNWTQQGKAWRKRMLRVEPLPPFITVPGHYLTFGRQA